MTLYDFLAGIVTGGFIVAGLFFLSFWRRTRDGLFLVFALAFWLLGLAQTILALGNVPVEERSWIFLIRLAAFMLILAAIVLVVSFAPDLVLLATGFIPGTTTAGVVGLMAMHVVVLVTAVVGYIRAEQH